MLATSNISYELTDRARAIAPGGIGANHLLAQRTGLVQEGVGRDEADLLPELPDGGPERIRKYASPNKLGVIHYLKNYC
jgi:hypothetical protein